MTKTFATLAIMAAAFLVIYSCSNSETSKTGTDGAVLDRPTKGDAFLDHRDSTPTKQEYDSPLFALSHDYPGTLRTVTDPSWDKVLNGRPISKANTLAYMDSLKTYVAPNLLPFFANNKSWKAAEHGWFHEPWLGTEREAIMGTYQGNGNPAGMFTTLKQDEAGYVLVLYDSTAAYTVGQIWGKTGQKINLANDAAQFAEGSVIVKLAFSNVNYPDWSVMQGAQTFSIFDTAAPRNQTDSSYKVRTVSFFQMDVIVKDSKASPKTGWVYSTFVYDKDAKGSAWDKMVPLGAMWGNDPDVNSPLTPPYPELSETMINPNAPAYSKETLGWGGRLSGPNDGAVAQQAVDTATGKVYNNLALSSCMSCHSPAQYQQDSFLLPAHPPHTGDTGLYVFTPGGPSWRLWFRDLPGNVPFSAGQTATDYDMVTAFKSIPNWDSAMADPGRKAMLREKREALRVFRQHRTGTRSTFWH